MTPERARRQRLLRVALLLQAAGLVALIAMTFPDWLDSRLRPLACTENSWCLDFRGLAFEITALFLGPVVLLLLVLGWRWRGPSRWPLAIVAVIDAAAIVLMATLIAGFLSNRHDMFPPYATAPPLILLPALATLALSVNLLRRVPVKLLLAVSTIGCILLSAFFWFAGIRPVQQGIPGELTLPFSKTVVYAARDLGCWDHVQGWVDEHTCTREALVVYRGGGDPAKDQQMIYEILLAQQRIQPADAQVASLPVGLAVNKTYSPAVDPANAGLCLIIIDRETTTPPKAQRLGCGSDSAYADIHSHWPGSAVYAIGIVYVWERPDYVSDHSVTILNAVSVRRGEAATLRVHADPNTSCSIVVVDSSGQTLVTGLGPKTTDSAGHVDWTWSVDPSAPQGPGSITVKCGSSSGGTGWYVNGPT